jgi:hypothetical protein
MKTTQQVVLQSSQSFITRTVIGLALIACAQAQGQSVYNTGYSTNSTPNGMVDNLWQVTAITNLPSGYSLHGPVPFAAFVTAGNQAYDVSTGPSGKPSSWISFNNPPFGQSDTAGIITTYTLNFNAPAASYRFNFEADNGVGIYLGAINPGDLVYSDGVNGSGIGGDYGQWHSTILNVTTGGNNQLNVLVFNTPSSLPGPNPTELRVDFTTIPVPEPSTLGLLGLGTAGLLLRRHRWSR